MKRVLKLNIFFITLAFLSVQTAFAESLFVDRELKLNFEPSEVQIFVEYDDGTAAKVPGLAFKESEATEEEKARWLIGGSVVVPSQSKTFNYSVFTWGPKGEFAFSEPALVDIQSEVTESEEILRREILRDQERLRSFKAQLSLVHGKLTRLRADASLIGNLGRIAQAKQDLEIYDSRIEDQERDIKMLESLIKAAKTQPRPVNFKKRETELTSQLAQLAAAAKQAENTEAVRRELNQVRSDEQYEIIDAAREEDSEYLRSRLEGLKKRRQILERRLGEVSG